MRNPARTAFGAIFQTEVLLNSKRAAPYVMLALFGFNAWLWTAKGAAAHNGWTMNGDYFIIRNLLGFSFLTLPLFTALIMGDPIGRDFRTGFTPLIFSKPVRPATYLLGKFSGNFFVLICCQSAFPLTMLVMQVFPSAGMILQPVRVFPYFKHFVFFVVVSQLALAAFHFTIGTLTRNPKIVYGLAVLSYPLVIAYQILFLQNLPPRWRGALDPLMLNWAGDRTKLPGGGYIKAELINQLAYNYDADAIANRTVMLLIAAACLLNLYVRFSTTERAGQYDDNNSLTTINLAPRAEWLDPGAEASNFDQTIQFVEVAAEEKMLLPAVVLITEGARAKFKQFMAAFGIEFRLLFAERGLVVIVPLATFVCVLSMAAYQEAVPDGLYTAAYAARTAESLLLFLFAIAVFFTGESMHRDRELRVEPVLWSVPAPDCVLLLSKFSATMLLSVSFSLLVGFSAVVLQIYRGHAPFELSVYLKVYAIIMLPDMLFMISAVTLLNVLLRDKYLAYAVCLAIGGGLFYLFNLGYNHWLYNPVLYGLWTPADLDCAGGGNLARILTHRIYCLAIAILFLSLAHLFFERKSTGGLKAKNRLRGAGWSTLILFLSTLIAIITGLMIGGRA